MAAKTLAAQYRESQSANLVPQILKTISRVKRATNAIVVLAMGISYTHQVHFLQGLGAGHFAYAIPLVFDLMIYISLKVSQTPGLATEAKRAAIKLLAGFTLISMLVNALAPGHVFLRLVIVLVVATIAAAEWLSGKIKPDFTALEEAETAAAPTTRKLDPAVAAERARKAAATRAAKAAATQQLTPAQKAAATRAARKAEKAAAEAAILAQLQAAYSLPAAPVSPAPQS